MREEARMSSGLLLSVGCSNLGVETKIAAPSVQGCWVGTRGNWAGVASREGCEGQRVLGCG